MSKPMLLNGLTLILNFVGVTEFGYDSKLWTCHNIWVQLGSTFNSWPFGDIFGIELIVEIVEKPSDRSILHRG